MASRAHGERSQRSNLQLQGGDSARPRHPPRWLADGALKGRPAKGGAGGSQIGLRPPWASLIGGAAQKIFQVRIYSQGPSRAALSPWKGLLGKLRSLLGSSLLRHLLGNFSKCHLGTRTRPADGSWGGHFLLRNTNWEEAVHPEGARRENS